MSRDIVACSRTGMDTGAFSRIQAAAGLLNLAAEANRVGQRTDTMPAGA
jgi:hypothetical protein